MQFDPVTEKVLTKDVFTSVPGLYARLRGGTPEYQSPDVVRLRDSFDLVRVKYKTKYKKFKANWEELAPAQQDRAVLSAECERLFALGAKEFAQTMMPCGIEGRASVSVARAENEGCGWCVARKVPS